MNRNEIETALRAELRKVEQDAARLKAALAALGGDRATSGAVFAPAPTRRKWTKAQKRVILQRAYAPGVVVADVARELSISPALLARWRRQLRQRGA